MYQEYKFNIQLSNADFIVSFNEASFRENGVAEASIVEMRDAFIHWIQSEPGQEQMAVLARNNPEDLTIRYNDVNKAQGFYIEQSNEIVISPEAFDFLRQLPAAQREGVSTTYEGLFAHEFGHAIDRQLLLDQRYVGAALRDNGVQVTPELVLDGLKQTAFVEERTIGQWENAAATLMQQPNRPVEYGTSPIAIMNEIASDGQVSEAEMEVLWKIRDEIDVELSSPQSIFMAAVSLHVVSEEAVRNQLFSGPRIDHEYSVDDFNQDTTERIGNIQQRFNSLIAEMGINLDPVSVDEVANAQFVNQILDVEIQSGPVR